jgi:hypothetical protein
MGTWNVCAICPNVQIRPLYSVSKVGIPETVKISWFAQLEWGYVWGHIFCRFIRGNDEDTHLFEDFWVPQLFCIVIQSAKQAKPPNRDLGCHTSNYCKIKIHNVSYLKPRNVKDKNRIMRVAPLPIAGQHFNLQATVPDSDTVAEKSLVS